MPSQLQTLLCCLVVVIAAPLARADERPEWKTPPPNAPQIAKASDEGEKALQAFKVPEGVTGSLFAAEPMVANIVAIYVDHQGNVYACETFRQSKGVEDNRGHGHWLDDDLAAQTVEDRYNYIQKHLGEKANDYTKEDDRLRLLKDTNGDHVADQVTIFADGFNEIVAGTGAGVLAYKDKVYYTCIPDLWLLEDENGDGKADVQESLHYGFGVRFAFRGHDMHGLTIGPDGRLYFSIGDRGYNVTAYRGDGVNPESGAVFRCELDGSKLEVFATGLRNPQELAFDDYGNLFTGDNNSDSGDKARWVNVVQGGDTGWRMSYQYLSDRGPFNQEKIWHPYHEGQPAYIIPPIANFADGPSGLAYYPGTGLSADFNQHFFLCDFRGQASNSGIRAIKVKPKGAFFEVEKDSQPFWNILATDVHFGPDGGVYVSDWVNGWEGLGKGRIYRFVDDKKQATDEVAEVAKLLAGDFRDLDESRLTLLLQHVDQRIRREAQFELVARKSFEALDGVARHNESQLARIHALWGLEQLARNNTQRDSAAETFAALLNDKDDEVRAQAAKMIGEIEDINYTSELTSLLADSNSRVRFMAAMSLGHLRVPQALDAVETLLNENNNRDPMLRHGGIMALVGIGKQDPDVVAGLVDHPSPAVRLAAVVALRKLESDLVSQFLGDAEPTVVVEAARAIHDLPLADSMASLADLIARPSDSPILMRRVLNANYRLGGIERAQAIANYAATASVDDQLQLDALTMLKNWGDPADRDFVLGMWRPIEARPADPAVEALTPLLPSLLGQGGDVATQAIETASALGITEVAPQLKAMLSDSAAPPKTRADALRALGLLKTEDLEKLVGTHLDAEAVALRSAALDLLTELDAEAALEKIQARVQSEDQLERQMAVLSLGKLKSEGAKQLLLELLGDLMKGEIPADVQLEVVEVAEQATKAEVKELLKEYRYSLTMDGELAPFEFAKTGGNAEAGRKIFYERTSLSCVRCHKVDGVGGEVGPDLSGIGVDKERDYLLEAIVLPTKSIAKGFESVMVQTIDGGLTTGIVKEENDTTLTLQTADGSLIEILQDDIDDMVPGKSSMPEDLMDYMSPRDLRDLVEFLVQRKTKATP